MNTSSSATQHSAKYHFLIPMGITICLLLFLCIILFFFIQKTTTADSLTYSQRAAEQIEECFNNASKSAGTVFDLLQYNSACQEMMSLVYFSQLSPELLEDYSKAINSFSGNLQIYDDLALYSPLWYSSRLYLRKNLQEFFSQIDGLRGTIPLGLHSSVTDPDHCYLVFGYNYYYEAGQQGALFISMDVRSNQYFPHLSNDSFYPALISADGSVCFVGINTADEAADPIYAKIREQLADFHSAGGVYPESNSDFYFQVTPLSSAGCTFIGVTNKNAIIYQREPIIVLCIFSVLCLLMILFVWFNILHRRILQPLLFLNHSIENMKSTDILDTSPQAPKLNACKEINNINSNFFDLLALVINLSRQVQETQNTLHQTDLLRKDAEIESLQHQINPHFLYNTLELIRADALRCDTQHISDTIAAMGKIYRYATVKKSMVLLSEEISTIKAYICIQKHRYRDSFSTIYNISPLTESVLIPKMILQPLVENSFVHGLELYNHFGTILISTELSESKVTVVIRDDGLGISKERLTEIFSLFEDEPPNTASADTSIGLTNVYKRLLLQYGKGNFVFSISSTPGDGTCITLQLPYQTA